MSVCFSFEANHDIVRVAHDDHVPRGRPRDHRDDEKTAYIAPGSPWENGYIESFNARLRNELLDGEIFCTLAEARIIMESWRNHYNTVRPHGSLGYKPPAPEGFIPAFEDHKRQAHRNKTGPERIGTT